MRLNNSITTTTRHDRRKQHTREQLKNAARALLIEIGYDALTIQDITDRADFARATFYVHFKDKDEILWEMLQDLFAEMQGIVYENLPKDMRLFHYEKWTRLFTVVQQQRTLLQAILGERGHITFHRRISDYMAQTIYEDMQGCPELFSHGSVPILFMANFLAGAMMQVIAWWLDTNADYNAQQMSGMFYEMVMREKPPQ